MYTFITLSSLTLFTRVEDDLRGLPVESGNNREVNGSFIRKTIFLTFPSSRTLTSR